MVAALKIARRPHDPRFAPEHDALRAVGPPIAPRVLDAGATPEGYPWLALEYLRGYTLRAWMDAEPRHGTHAPRCLLALLERLALAVDRMHATGIVHRDLKPSNVFLCTDTPERIALIDFGIAVTTNPDTERITASGQRVGTALYMAPEQISDPHAAQAASDRYALAVIAFELLTGTPPFEGTAGKVEYAHVALRVPRASTRTNLPALIDSIFARGLAKEASARYETATAFVTALAGALQAGDPKYPITPGLDSPREDTSTSGTPETRRRIAVLGMYAASAPTAVASAMEPFHGRVVRMQGNRIIVAFDAVDLPAAGVRDALRAARELPTQIPAVVHVITALLRRGARTLRLQSAELDVLDWLPAPDTFERESARVLLTTSAAALWPRNGGPAQTPGYVKPDLEDESPPLLPKHLISRTREDVFDALAQEARICVDMAIPGLCVLTGATGLGKSYLLGRLAESLAQYTCVVRLQATQRDARLLQELASAAIGVDVTATDSDTLRLACEHRAGPDLGARGWAALAAHLGHLPPAAGALLPSAPGAVRFTLAEFLAAALRATARTGTRVIILDDAEYADSLSLDALELAAIDDSGDGPWICIAGSAALLAQRPELGLRAARHTRHVLEPLSADSARSLLTDLLHPVERAPEEALAMIEQMAEGVPLYLTEIVHALRASGAIRRRRGTGAWYLASDDLLSLSATPLATRIAVYEMDKLPGTLQTFAATAAVLGDEFDLGEMDAVRTYVEVEGGCDYGELDSGVAITRLTQQHLITRRPGGRYGVRHPMLRAGIESSLDADARYRLHDAVYRWLRTTPAQTAGDFARRAWHAERSGRPHESVDCWLAAADADTGAHEYVRAERCFSAAIAQMDTGEASLLFTALSGRASVRRRLERWADALADIERAHAGAQALGDERAIADCLLEEATILDWTYRWAESAESVQRVAPLMARLDDRRIQARFLLARGRCEFRNHQYERALSLLDRSVDMARDVADHDTLVAALLLIPVLFIIAARPAEAEERFAEVVSLCERTGDVHHLATALNNRIVLWQSVDQLDHALADARRSMMLARRLGHTTLESTATHNLAELLYYHGQLDEALELAMRARSLYHRHAATLGPDHDLLVARIHNARGDRDTVDAMLVTLRDYAEDTWSESARLIVDALTLAHDDGPAWTAVVERARTVSRAFPAEHLEILYMALSAAASSRRHENFHAWLAEAQAIASARSPWWQRRLAALNDA